MPDNNAAERAIRPIALGRKNWLFAGSDKGGERAAAILSLIETAKLGLHLGFDRRTFASFASAHVIIFWRRNGAPKT